MIAAQLQMALVEADPARDREFRQKAEGFYDGLIAWLKAHADMKKYRLDKYREERGEGNVAYSYEMTSETLGLKKEYPHLSVVIAPFRTGTARFGKRGNRSFIVMPVLTGSAAVNEDGNLMARDLGYVREVFIHEFIHYLDDLRYKGKVNSSKGEKGTSDKKGYFNSPVEFNAYFQGGASEIERHAAKLGPGEFAKKFGRVDTGFKKFRKEFEHVFSKSWKKALEGKWKQKYEVRLWQLHQDLLARSRGTE